MLVLDVGGSFVKYGLADGEGNLIPGSAGQVPSDADGSYEHFLDVLRRVIAENREKMNFTAASVSIPGPFDYFGGISRMKHKFTALYGKTISGPFDEAGVKVSYLHDSTAFLLGEASEQDGPSPCGVMLGTGLGFAMMRDGKVCVNPAQTPAAVVWNMPWKDGIAEDYVSQRALMRPYDGKLSVYEISRLARSGDEKAAAVFRDVGRELSGMLAILIGKLGCTGLVLGGQISKSADLFRLDIPVPWRVCEHPEESALRGAGRFAAFGREACVLETDPICLSGGEK